MITDAMIDKPKRKATRLGTFGEVLYALSPKTVDQVLNTAYNLFPDSKAAKKEEGRDRGRGAGGEERGDVHRGRGDGVPDARSALLDGGGPCPAVLAAPGNEGGAALRRTPRRA